MNTTELMATETCRLMDATFTAMEPREQPEDREIECPRCGSTNIKADGPNDSDTWEFVCMGKCKQRESFCQDAHALVYFQYDRRTKEYAWPMSALYALHEDYLEDFRQHKIQPRLC
jgi:hypothetical protein